jgi:hypothetical protein
MPREKYGVVFEIETDILAYVIKRKNKEAEI